MYTLGVLALLRSRFSALHHFGTLLQCYFISCPMLSVLARLNGRVLGCGYVVETLSGALHIFDSVSIALLLWVTLFTEAMALEEIEGFVYVIRTVVAQKSMVGDRTWR